MLKNLKIAYANTKDRLYFNELWSSTTLDTLKKFNCNLLIPDFNSQEENRELWKKFLADCDAIITTWNSPCIDQEILDVAPNLKVVGHAAGSLAGYISDEVFSSGVNVTSANDNMAHSVAEWCLMASLIGRRHMVGFTNFGSQGKMNFADRSKCLSIKNSIVGIWGFGSVAKSLVNMLKPFYPAKIQVDCNYITEEEAEKFGIELVDFDTLVKNSDILFTLKGLTPKTRGFFDKKYLSMLKDGMTLVNGGRAEFFNEDEFIAELKLNRFNAVLDVFHEEPLPQDNPLQFLKNVILTGHNAGYPSRFDYISTILEEFNRYFNNEELLYQVSKERIASMTSKKR